VGTPATRSLTVAHAKQANRAAAYAFHRRHAGEYLWPREPDAFAELIDARQIYIAEEGAHIVGLCYVADDGDRWEFGGAYVEDELRGRGVAGVLGRVAIATTYLMDEPAELIAHVHEFNSAPRGLLVGLLGFVETGEKEIPPIDPPPNMARNDAGDVVGDLFRFHQAALDDFADWFDRFDGTVTGKSGVITQLTLNVDLWKQRASLLAALRELAAGRP